jgi:hypothetical protein
LPPAFARRSGETPVRLRLTGDENKVMHPIPRTALVEETPGGRGAAVVPLDLAHQSLSTYPHRPEPRQTYG